MIIRLHVLIITVYFFVPGVLAAESFVVDKRKPQKQSLNKLKEDYADELAGIVRTIPALQKQLAEIQELLIDQLYDLLNNDTQLSKIELDARTCKARELRSCLEDKVIPELSCKSTFIHNKKTSAIAKGM